MARTVLVAGTASHVGKSTVAAGLCRRLAREGVAVAPFKAQNMSNNARAVATPDCGWGEIGVSQYAQARAAGVVPTTDANPVLLKPSGAGESQLVVHGAAVGHFEPGTYYDEHWEQARRAAVESYERIAAEYDVVVAEGAGSVAEVNLHDRDLANVETARFADASILLLGEIERGGVFASLYGTLELMPEDLRDRVCGLVVTKFRGDAGILEPGIDELEERTGVPVLAVLPYDDPGLPAEDSVTLPSGERTAVFGDDDGVTPAETVTVGVPRLPRISNFTDLEPLARVPGVRVAYVPPGASLDDVDAVVLPGTKNTVDDLHALQEAGFGEALAAFDGPVVGICGGYQMLGERITNAAVEGAGDADVVEGFGRLPVETRFSPDKRVEGTTVDVDGSGPIAGAAGTASGYEIHMGRTRHTAPIDAPLGDRSAATGSVLGTYLHGLFDVREVREAFLETVFLAAGVERPDWAKRRPSPYDAAADLVAEIDLDRCL
jgi:adenosylcobyric acid synthase